MYQASNVIDTYKRERDRSLDWKWISVSSVKEERIGWLARRSGGND